MQLSFLKRPLLPSETPISLYQKIRSPHSFLLQSGQNGNISTSKSFSKTRWSFIGFNPLKKYLLPSSSTIKPFKYLDQIQQLFSKYKITPQKNFPPFYGGLVGFFSYDFGVKFEKIKQTVSDDLECPEVYLNLYDQVICIDHQKNEIWFFGWGKTSGEASKKLHQLVELINASASSPIRPPLQPIYPPKLKERRRTTYNLQPNLTYSQYSQKIARIKKYFALGHTYQVNLSRRFKVAADLDPFLLYQKVTKINPSPFQAYFATDNFAVISNSPEKLFQINYNLKEKKYYIETSPIKGTIGRGKTKALDLKNQKTLLASKKDQAELEMIVDMARNDIGKVCQIGSVKVSKHRYLEGYSHVWHTMSDVIGILKKDVTFPKIIKALLPGASITGCPKKRTMEIIDELEDFKRGVYCGSAGFIGFDGQMNFNIMIRTMFYQFHRRGQAYLSPADNPPNLFFHSGGGIVVDSHAKSEYLETLDKAKALIKSLENM